MFAKAQEKSIQAFDAFKSQSADYQKILDTHFKQLEDQKAKAERHLTEVKEQYQELDLTHLINKISVMVENFENLSIDLNSFFDKDTEDDLWKKFYNGDHGAFAHHVAKKLTRKEILKIRELYETDSDFKKLANTYLSEFRTLLNATQKSDKPQTLLAVISGSEIGKIYYILTRALDKIS